VDRRGLLASDLDGTLLGNERALERFAQWFEERRGRFLLAYASGRFFDSVVDTIRGTALPEPDAVLGGVGSQMVSYPSGAPIWLPGENHNGAWNADKVREALRGVPGLTLQAGEYQSARKVSYYLEGADLGRLAEIEKRLRDAALAADTIYSSARDLDVLPRGVNKGSAVGHFARWARVDPSNVMVSGDTGNDLSMFERGFRGIVVANAEPVLRSLVGETVYQARAEHAAGVLEGIEYWLTRRARNEPY